MSNQLGFSYIVAPHKSVTTLIHRYFLPLFCRIKKPHGVRDSITI